MFLRANKRFKDGKEHRYWSIVESYRAERLTPYWTRLQARLGRPGSAAVALTPAFARRAIGRAILRSAWLTRRVVLDGWFLQGD